MRLKEYTAALERERAGNQLTVRNIRKTADLQHRLEETFPEIAVARWGVTTVPYDATDALGIEYFLIPVWFTETFIIDHQNAASPGERLG